MAPAGSQLLHPFGWGACCRDARRLDWVSCSVYLRVPRKAIHMASSQLCAGRSRSSTILRTLSAMVHTSAMAPRPAGQGQKRTVKPTERARGHASPAPPLLPSALGSPAATQRQWQSTARPGQSLLSSPVCCLMTHPTESSCGGRRIGSGLQAGQGFCGPVECHRGGAVRLTSPGSSLTSLSRSTSSSDSQWREAGNLKRQFI